MPLVYNVSRVTKNFRRRAAKRTKRAPLRSTPKQVTTALARSAFNPGRRITRITRVVSNTVGATTLPIGYVPSTGFQNINGGTSLGFNMQIYFTLGGMCLCSNGTLISTIPLPGYTEFTSLFDQYMIEWVDVMVVYTHNTAKNGDANSPLPLLYVAKDYTDANGADLSAVMQYDNVQMHRFGSESRDGAWHVRIRPRCDSSVYNSITSSGFSPIQAYIQSTNANVPHYGLKLALDNPAATAGNTVLVGEFSFVCKYHLALKAVN